MHKLIPDKDSSFSIFDTGDRRKRQVYFQVNRSVRCVLLGVGGIEIIEVHFPEAYRPEEFSSGDSAGDFGLRSFRRPEIAVLLE